MKEIANMLGVELYENFYIKCNLGLTDKNNNETRTQDRDWFCFDEYGLKCTSVTPYINSYLVGLLNGDYSIERKPWKPTYHEKYYSIGPGGVLEPGDWLNDFIDQAMYKLGNCYRTVEEASANRDKWIKFYSSDDLIEL